MKTVTLEDLLSIVPADKRNNFIFDLHAESFPYCTAVYKWSARHQLFQEFKTKLDSWREDKFLYVKNASGGAQFFTAPNTILNKYKLKLIS